MRLVESSLEVLVHLILGEREGTAVGVVDNGHLFKGEQVVQQEDILKGVSSVSTDITENDDLCLIHLASALRMAPIQVSTYPYCRS